MSCSGGCGKFPGLLFTSRPVYEIVHEDKRGRYSGHGSEKSDIIFDDGDKRRNISRDGGDLRGDIKFGDNRRGSRSK